ILLLLILISSLFSIILVWLFGFALLYRVRFLLIKLQLAEGDYIKEVNPFEIMFSQSTINNMFQIGNDIENTIDDLVNSKVKIEDFLMIQVCIIDDIFYSSDNRRLYIFQEAICQELNIKKIPVKVRQVSDINIR